MRLPEREVYVWLLTALKRAKEIEKWRKKMQQELKNNSSSTDY